MAIRYLQIESGLGDPFAKTSWPRLEYVLKGIKRNQAETGAKSKPWLPITPTEPNVAQGDIKMIWAACCLCFFGFLRCGKMTVPGDSEYDPAVHLSFADVSFDHPSDPSVIQVHIKSSKMDLFRKGVFVYLGRTNADLCPVSALLGYLCARGSSAGALFRFSDGKVLSRPRFVERVRSALRLAGVDQAKYCSHSFRIGAATTVAAKGVEDCVIKTLGRWESAAYLRYVKIPREQLAGYSLTIASD